MSIDPIQSPAHLQSMLAMYERKIEDLEYRNSILLDKMEETDRQNKGVIAKLEGELAQLRQYVNNVPPSRSPDSPPQGMPTTPVFSTLPPPVGPPPTLQQMKRSREEDDVEPIQIQEEVSDDPKDVFFVKLAGILPGTHESDIRDLVTRYGRVRYFRMFPPSSADAIFCNRADAARCAAALNNTPFQNGKVLTATLAELRTPAGGVPWDAASGQQNRTTSLFVKINALPAGTPDTAIKEALQRFGPMRYFRMFLCNAEGIFINNEDAIRCVEAMNNTQIGGNIISAFVRLQDPPQRRNNNNNVQAPIAPQQPARPVVCLPRDINGEAIANAIRNGIVNQTLVKLNAFPFGKQEDFIRSYLSKYGDVTFAVICLQDTLVNFRTHAEARQCVQSLHNTHRGPNLMNVTLATEVQIA